jgi:hypothetical protein
MRARRQFVVGAALLTLCACGTSQATPLPSPTGSLELRQPSVTDLQQFVPGGVDMSSSADKSAGAPLICGGSRPAILADAAVVGVPDSLASVSVVHYRFGSGDAATGYFEAIRSQVPSVTSGCKAAAANSGVFSAVSLFAFKGQPQINASGTTAFPIGLYAGALQYNVLDFFRQGSDVFEIRVDRQTRYPDIQFEYAIERMMNHGTSKIPGGAHSAQPAHLDGVIQLGSYLCCMEKSPPIGPIGNWALSRNRTCPEVVVSGTPYTIEMENQLLNVSSNGMVVFSSSGGAPTTIHWGQRVSVTVDDFANATAFGCDIGHATTAMQANVLTITANP